jgi:hypothetical protein
MGRTSREEKRIAARPRGKAGLAFSTVAAALLFTAAAAQPPSAPVQQPALWAVTDADSTIYLFGTVHLGISGQNWGGPAALAAAQEVWTEIDLASAQGEAIQQLVRTYGVGERPLSAVVGSQRWAQIVKKCAEIGASPEAVDRLRPWVVSLIFAVPELVRNPKALGEGADQIVEQRAAANQQRLRTLETAEQQVRMFAGLPEAAQLAMLYETLDGGDATMAKDDNIVAAWAIGDDATVARVFADTVHARHPEIYDAVIRQRNAAWADVLAREMAGAGVDFVAVGAGHLAGPDSVQAMLAARGFKVTRVTPAPR